MSEHANGQLNGAPRTTDDLREELRRLRLEKKIAAERMTNRVLRESWGQSWTGDQWGDFVDPSDAFRDYDLRAAFPIGNRYDRQDGRNRPWVWSDLDLDMIRGQARYVEGRNMYAQGLLRMVTNYTVKTGFSWEAQPRKRSAKDDAVLKLAGTVNEFFEEWEEANGSVSDDNEAVNGIESLERSSVRRNSVDGDVFMRLFPQDDGLTFLRFAEPEQIRQPMSSPSNWWGGIQTAPDDIWRVISYAVAYEEPEDWENVPACWMAHMKANVPENVKRGISDFFSTADAFVGALKLLKNMRETGAVQAAIAWIEQFDKNVTGGSVGNSVVAARDQNRTYYPQAVTGKEINYQKFESATIVKTGANRTYAAAPLASNTTQHVSILQAALRALGVRWGMPEYMVSGDSSNANYASTMISGSPFVNAIECNQNEFGNFFKRWRWIALRHAANSRRFNTAGKTWCFDEIKRVLQIHGTPPEVGIANKGEDTAAASAAIQDGVMSRQTRREQLGLDNDREKQRIAEEKPPEPPLGANPETPPPPVQESRRGIDLDAAADAFFRAKARHEVALQECGGEGGKPGPCPDRSKAKDASDKAKKKLQVAVEKHDTKGDEKSKANLDKARQKFQDAAKKHDTAQAVGKKEDAKKGDKKPAASAESKSAEKPAEKPAESKPAEKPAAPAAPEKSAAAKPTPFAPPDAPRARDMMQLNSLGNKLGEATTAHVTPSQQKAIAKYTGKAYKNINGELRAGITDGKYAGTIKEMREAFATAPVLKEPVTTYRGIALSAADHAAFESKLKDAYKSGQPIEMDGFTSTSTDIGAARGFSGADTGQKSLVMEIAVKKGIYADKFSGFDEREMLLDHKSKFKVVGAKSVVVSPGVTQRVLQLEQVA